MKNLKKLFGLMVASGLAFGFAGTVNAETTGSVMGPDVKDCLENSGTATCTLTADQTISSQIAVQGNITLKIKDGVVLTLGDSINVTGSLKINGGTIKNTNPNVVNTIKVEPKGSLTTDNVKIISETTTPVHATQAVIAVFGDSSTADKTTVNIGANTTIEGYAGLIVYPEESKAGSLSGTQANNVTVNLNGTWKTTSYVIQVQGIIKSATNPAVININGGSYTSEHNTALYASGLAKWNINAGTVKGTEAIVIKGGDVTINGGTFTATGTTSADTGLNSGVASHAGWTGATVAVVGNSSYAGQINLEINDGKFTSENKNALYFDVTSATSKFKSAKINNGTFVSPEDQEALWRSNGNPGKIIYGGTFIGKTSAIDNKSALAENFQSKTVGDVTYVGTPHDITLTGINVDEQTIENGTIDELHIPASAVAGQPINIADIIKVTADNGLVVKYVVTDKDGKEVTIKDGSFVMPDSDVNIAVSIVEPGQEPTINPSEPTKPTDTNTNKKPAADNTASKNPQTYDAGIMGSLVLVLSSVGTLGYASKKVLSK